MSHAKDKFEAHIRNKDTMDFEEFFEMSREILLDEIKRNPTMVIDTDEVEASCFLCPYAIDKKTWVHEINDYLNLKYYKSLSL